MAKSRQTEMFEQKKIAAIEKWADKFDDTRTMIGDLQEELKNAEFKLAEAVHANEAAVDHQEGKKGQRWLVYERNGYSVKIKQGKETVNVKIAKAQKGAPVDDATPAGAE